MKKRVPAVLGLFCKAMVGFSHLSAVALGSKEHVKAASRGMEGARS